MVDDATTKPGALLCGVFMDSAEGETENPEGAEQSRADKPMPTRRNEPKPFMGKQATSKQTYDAMGELVKRYYEVVPPESEGMVSPTFLKDEISKCRALLIPAVEGDAAKGLRPITPDELERATRRALLVYKPPAQVTLRSVLQKVYRLLETPAPNGAAGMGENAATDAQKPRKSDVAGTEGFLDFQAKMKSRTRQNDENENVESETMK